MKSKSKVDYFFIDATAYWKMVEAVDVKIDVDNPLITCGVKTFSFSRYDTILMEKKFDSISVAVDINHLAKTLGKEEDATKKMENNNMSTGIVTIIVLLALILR